MTALLSLLAAVVFAIWLRIVIVLVRRRAELEFYVSRRWPWDYVAIAFWPLILALAAIIETARAWTERRS